MPEAPSFPFRAMGSPCELHLHRTPGVDVAEVAHAVSDEVLRIERKYSRYRDDSVTAKIVASAGSRDGVDVDEETAGLLDYADTAHRESGGLFDPTSGVLRQVWDFKSGSVPARARVERVLERVGWQRARWERPRLRLGAGMEFDFGGFGKEYAVDRAVALARRLGVRHGLVDLGGDLGVIGPHPDGSAWQVGIRHPRRPETAAARIPLAAGALATSGDYERFMVVGGRRYSHLLDPRSGFPAAGGAASVSIVASQCLVAGTASTVAMLKGRQGFDWLRGLGLPHLWIGPDGRPRGSLGTPTPPHLRIRSRARSADPSAPSEADSQHHS